jgi:hypothetical protein
MSANTDLKTSVLVNRQVPEFVRDEYPTFVNFLEAYYEFLETKQASANNDLISASKSLRTISDVDDSIEAFQNSFYNMYATLIPLEIQADKALLFKHLVSLYKSKGSDNSFKLLFRLVFGEDIDIILPKNNVLKPSSSDWITDQKLRINTQVASRYVGDGVNNTFILAQIAGQEELTVYVNGQLQTGNYVVNREYRKLRFTTPPANNSIILVNYDTINSDIFYNRKVTGLTSGATAIVEQASKRIVSDTLNLGLPIELRINSDSLVGNFLNGEEVTIPIIDPDGVLIDIRASTFSIVKQINVITGGINYKVGDPILIFGGFPTSNAVGTVKNVFSGTPDRVLIYHGGAVFANGDPVRLIGNTFPLTIVVDGIDQTGKNAANTFIVSTDVVGTFNGSVHASNTLISSADYGFPNANNPTGENVSTRIVDALSYITLQVGPISNVKILPGATETTTVTPALDVFGALYGDANSPRTPKSLGSIARFKINNGGRNYVIGDTIVFGRNPLGTHGQFAYAKVANANTTGAITRIDVSNATISGIATVTSSCTIVTGAGTDFTLLGPKDVISINNQSRTVATVSSPTVLEVTSVFTTSDSGTLEVFNRYPLGGIGYVQNNFPSVTVSSVAGFGADIEIDSIASDNERLQPTTNLSPGAILSTQVLVSGSGYQYAPIAQLITEDGTGADLQVDIERSYLSSPGRWTTSDSILSSTERKIAGQEYYVDYSYIISSQTEFYRYKKILKELLHPVGFVNYADYKKTSVVQSNPISVTNISETTISGTVNVGNGSIVVTGSNTKFNLAVQRGALSVGSYISVNGEIRTVRSINSNTTLITSSNVSEIKINRSGSSYSNGYLTFSGGGGTVQSVDIITPGSGYQNGPIVWYDADQAIAAVGTITVDLFGRVIATSVTNGGLFSQKPGARPYYSAHKVITNSSITIANTGAGYINGYFTFVGGAPLRAANASYEVYPSNGAIRSVNVIDGGLYTANPTIVPNTSPNVVVSAITVSNGVRSITTNSGAYGVNSFVIFTGGGTAITPANARIYVDTTGAIVNVLVTSFGVYTTNTVVGTANTGNATLTLDVQKNYGIGHSNGILVISDGGTANRSAQVAVEVYSSNGAIRKLTLIDSGLYSSTPNVALNTTPLSVTAVTANTVSYYGRAHQNGYIRFSGGDPIYNANASYTVDANGVVNAASILFSNVGLYRSRPTASVDNNAVSITEVLPTAGGAGYSDGYIIVMGGSPLVNTSLTANTEQFANSRPITNANIRFVTSGTGTGRIIRTIINNAGLFANSGNINIDTAVLNVYPNVVTISSISANAGAVGVNSFIIFGGGGDGNIAANARIFVNTSGHIQNVVLQYPGSYWGVPVANANVGNASFTITMNAAPPVAVNSFVVFTGGGPFSAVNVANALIRVDSRGYIENVNVRSAGIYTTAPIATINTGGGNAAFTIAMGPTLIYSQNGAVQWGRGATFRLSYNANTTNIANFRHTTGVTTVANTLYTANVYITANSNVRTNAVFTINASGNVQTIAVFDVNFNEVNTIANAYATVNATGAIQNVTINTVGDYFYPPNIAASGGGTGALLTVNTKGIFTQTANNQAAVFIKGPPASFLSEDGYYVTTEDGYTITTES